MASPPLNGPKRQLEKPPRSLRQEAEAKLRQDPAETRLEGDALHELRVHQIELEMQNDELRRTQIELETIRARYFDLYELAPVGYCTLTEQGLIREANLTAVTLLGSARSLVLNQPLFRFVVREDHPTIHALLQQVPGGGARRLAEARLQRGDGTRFWAQLVVSAEVSAAGGRELRLVLSDVTARRTAEDERREGEARYRDLFTRATDGIVLATLDGTVIEANDAFAHLHGLVPDRLTGEKLKTFDVGEVALSPEHLRRMERGERLTVELEHRGHGGKVQALEVSLSRVQVSGEQRILAFYRDVSARKRLQAALAQTDQLASMGMIAAGVAHEVNNPLAVVMSNLESLIGDLPGMAASTTAAADLLERAKSAMDAAERIKVISRSLGVFARVERLEAEDVDLNRSLQRAAAMAHHELKFRARLQTQYGQLPLVHASEGRLTQVFLNLIMNAVQAIDEGHVADHSISLRTWATATDVFAEICDTGHGMTPETMARIFEPFFTTRTNGQGLGLSICKTLMTELGGELTVESTPAQGTRFLVRLKIAKGTVLPKLHLVPAVLPPSGRARILVVDDEPAIRRALSRLLGREHDVMALASGKEAQALLAHDKAFDIILCDLMMPEMTGMELHAWLAEADPALARRVVFISGGAFTPRAAAYLEQVDNREFSKPFVHAELKALVAAMMAPPALV
jgi:PAS domain S-box-containing protein